MADKTPKGLAMILMAQKHPDMASKMDSDSMDDSSDTDAPAEAPMSEETLHCAQAIIDAVHEGKALELAHALKDMFMELDSAEDAAEAPTDASPDEPEAPEEE